MTSLGGFVKIVDHSNMCADVLFESFCMCGQSVVDECDEGDDDAVAPMTIPNSLATIVPKERLTFRTMSKTGSQFSNVLSKTG